MLLAVPRWSWLSILAGRHIRVGLPFGFPSDRLPKRKPIIDVDLRMPWATRIQVSARAAVEVLMAVRRTGLVFDQRFLQHETGTIETLAVPGESAAVAHPSAVAITRRIKEHLDVSGLTSQMEAIPARPATDDELAAYHNREYIAALEAYAAGKGDSAPPGGDGDSDAPGATGKDGGYVDSDTPIGPGSVVAARWAVGGTLNATHALMEGVVDNAYALLRPAGHHALRARAMGFCLFNNAALAALYARAVFGVERTLIVDWDVHHGNGTQAAFYSDPGVLYLSLHQRNWFPAGSGNLDQVGVGVGEGYTVNLPLPPGTGDRGYIAAFERIVIPIGLQYRPELVIISAGQDGSFLDPMARMMLTSSGFRRLSELLLEVARQTCAGRLVMVQEGGYSLEYVPHCTVAAVEPLLGVESGLADPDFFAVERAASASEYLADTLAALEEARQWHARWWRL
jgi:acetoin utilization deacetylase AcuC-like enzyme